MQNYKLDWSPYLGPIFGIFFFLYFCVGIFLLCTSKKYKIAKQVIEERKKGITDENREFIENGQEVCKKGLIGCALYVVIPITIIVVFDIVYTLIGGRKFDVEPEFHMKHIRNIIFMAVLWGVIGIKLFPQKSKKTDDSKENGN